MNLEQIKQEVMALAAAQNFGVRPEEILVAEKAVLIHSEISEVFEASLKNQVDGKDGVAEELADVLIRILHLGGIYEVDFLILPETPSEFITAGANEQILRLHLLISQTWEDYRRGRLAEFKEKLVLAAAYLIAMSEKFKIDLNAAVAAKMKLNQNRDWRTEGKPNEKFIFKA
ncbi:MAG: hypothetical protein WCT37_00575 [Patescibacteria group bacterium]|jgi:NTP pyrophosphatase (non-canonical NTP hydrolase)